jgi:hypothetical protein
VLFCTAASGLLAANAPATAQQLRRFVGTLFFQTSIYLSLSVLLLVVFAFLQSPLPASYRKLKETRSGGALCALFGEKSLFLLNLLLLFAITVAVYFLVFVPMFTKMIEHPFSLTAVHEGRPPLMDISLGFFFVLLVAIFYSLVVQLLTFASKRIGREIAALILLFLVMLPILTEGLDPAGLTRVLNPVVVLMKLLPDHGKPDTKLAFMALVFYSTACALLGALLYAKARTYLPEAPPAPAETPTAVEPESVS